MSRAFTLIEMAFDPGEFPDYIDPRMRDRLADRSHRYAQNPAYPDWTPGETDVPENWEELLASEQYRHSLAKMQTYLSRITGNAEYRVTGDNFMPFVHQMMAAVREATQIEAGHKKELERLAIQLIFEQPEFRRFKEPWQKGEFKIIARLGFPDLSSTRTADEVEQDEEQPQEEQDWAANVDPEEEIRKAQEAEDFNLEVEKRKFLNAMTQGAGISKNYAFAMLPNELNRIDPRLMNLYGLIMSTSEAAFFQMPEEEIAQASKGPKEQQAGGVDLSADEGGVPVIRATAQNFPVLVQEIAKGIMELVSRKGLPSDPVTAQRVIKKADLADDETWQIILGRRMWQRFINSIDASKDELTLFLADKVNELPPREFNALMQKLQAGGPEAERIVAGLIKEIEADLAREKEEPEGEGGWQDESAQGIVDDLLR